MDLNSLLVLLILVHIAGVVLAFPFTMALAKAFDDSASDVAFYATALAVVWEGTWTYQLLKEPAQRVVDRHLGKQCLVEQERTRLLEAQEELERELEI